MTLHVDALEALWFVVNTTTLALTLLALLEARRDLVIARNDETVRHQAREITAYGNLRREGLRVVTQLLLISVVVPGLFSDRPITLSPALLALVLVPVVVLTSTVFDARDRSKLGAMLLELVKADRELLALESSVQEGNELTREGIRHAEAAYHEANDVNRKIADLTELVAGKEDKADVDVDAAPERVERYVG